MPDRKTRSTLKTEKLRLLQHRWETLPASVKTNGQLSGRAAVACGATHHVMERCDFACTCCYLGSQANETEPLPFEEVCEQLNLLRRELGHGGKAQITAGEVTLLPLAELGAIVAYALKLGLDPMVMTHGQRFLDDPDYLKALVSQYGLRKVSIHVDSTQRGRRGVKRGLGEVELNEVRDRFAKLVRQVRMDTGCDLKAASTLTVTEQNVNEMEEVSAWFFDNADAFRLISFQPVANVGRTRGEHDSSSLRDSIWASIERIVGRSLNRNPMQFGHSSCNVTAPFVVATVAGRHFVVEAVRAESRWDARIARLLMELASCEFDFTKGYGEDIRAVLAIAARRPLFALEGLAYAFWRGLGETPRWLPLLGRMLLRREWPKVRPLLVVVHSFMDAKELETEEGEERLDACVFKLPVDGKMVSMCEMNASGMRQRIDARLAEAAKAKAAT